MFVQEKGATVSPEILVGMRHLGTYGNKDGMGVMWVENGRVQVEKDLAKTDDSVLALYDKHKDKACAVHQRNQTKGKVNVENCHPFMVTSIDDGDPWDIYMMHNGTIQDVQVDTNMADSYNFATYFLRYFLKEYPEASRSFHFCRIIGGLIPKSKIVLLSATGDPSDMGHYTIINSGQGRILEPGIWVSRNEPIAPKKAYTSPIGSGPVEHTPPSGAAQEKEVQQVPLDLVAPTTSPPISTALTIVPANTSVNPTPLKMPIQLGSFVMQPNGLKVFRITDPPAVEPIELNPPDVEEDIDLTVLGRMSEGEIEYVVEEQPSLAARLLHRLSRAF